MKIKDTIGIDMSKLNFDACIYSNKASKEFENSKKGYKQLVAWAYKNSNSDNENIIFIFEHTLRLRKEIKVYPYNS